MNVGEAELHAMRRAIAISQPTHPHPNPRVGAVIVDAEGRIVAEGAHQGPGQPHAERVALQALGDRPPAGSTLVVTLEPCNHHGRTPPCTAVILAAGVSRVVFGASDPDPDVAGGGGEHLRGQGVEVVAGVLSDEVEAAEPAYFHHRRTGRPLVVLKSAMTLDGQTAALDGTSRWITDEEARLDTHLLRSRQDAVVVGAGTLRTDDPTLTVRLDGYEGAQPAGVVVKGRRPLPEAARLWRRPEALVISVDEPEVNVDHVRVPPGPDGRPDPNAVIGALAQRGFLAVLVEGGATLAGALWRAGLIDRGVTYLGARMAGGAGMPMLGGHWETIAAASPMAITGVRKVGGDIRVEWEALRE